jgi:hypothetical protein
MEPPVDPESPCLPGTAFVLTPLGSGRTRVDQTETFGGLLLPIARSMVYDATVQSFHALNAALARRAADSVAGG